MTPKSVGTEIDYDFHITIIPLERGEQIRLLYISTIILQKIHKLRSPGGSAAYSAQLTLV